jgi:hypothetical protein
MPNYYWFPTPAEAATAAAIEEDFAATNARFQTLYARNLHVVRQLAMESLMLLDEEDMPAVTARFTEGLSLLGEITNAYGEVRSKQRALHAINERMGFQGMLYA